VSDAGAGEEEPTSGGAADQTVTLTQFDLGAEGSAIVAESPELSFTIALTPDVTLEEAAAAMRGLDPRNFVPIDVPASVKTVGDFFGEDMGRSIARQIADQVYGPDEVDECAGR
jgi:hypothetical protein